jgi:seryl-tRNA synthetase
MLDIKIIRNNPEAVKDSIKKRCLNLDVDAFLALDKEVVEQKIKVEDLRAIRNKVSKEIPTLSADEKGAKIAEMKDVNENIRKLEEELSIKENELKNLHYKMPNMLDPTASIGETDEDNEVVFTFGDKTKFDFDVKPHYEIGEKKGWIDIEKGSEVSGSRFWYLKGDIALLQFAIMNFAVNKLVGEGFNPILPPVLVREQAMFGTGFFPADEDGIYSVNPGEDDLFLVGTAEVPVTSYHSNEVLNVDEPIKYVGYSPCFRREAGSAGKDTRGILRGHQFDKVEMVVFAKPEDSQKVHDYMVGVEESVRQDLKIPYQKVNVCSGDLGNPAMKKYDLEAWMPAQEKYREVTSCSNV